MRIAGICCTKQWDTNFNLRGTDDIDLAVAIADWRAYDELASALPTVGDTGIRYKVGGVSTDILPFGMVEAPTGIVTPASRHEAMSVWAFQEIFDCSDQLELPSVGAIQIPTVAGYAALKLAAWLDRSQYGQYKDAADIAIAFYWYINDSMVHDRLYSTDIGAQLLIRYELDRDLAAAHLFGTDIAHAVGYARILEMMNRWPGPRSQTLSVEMRFPAAPVDWVSADRRQQFLDAMAQAWT